MNQFVYIIQQNTDSKELIAINDLLFSGYISFVYKNFSHNSNTNTIPSSILQKLYSTKVYYKKILYEPNCDKSFNQFQLSTLRKLLIILENMLDKNPISKYIKYDIDAIQYYYAREDNSATDHIIDFINSYCRIYNLNDFEGDVSLPRFIFDKDLIIVNKFKTYYNISVSNKELINSNLSLDFIIQRYFADFILSILTYCKTFDDVIKLGDNLFLEYSHEYTFNQFFITEIFRKIHDSNFDYSQLISYGNITINSFVFRQRLVDILFSSTIDNLYIPYICILLNISGEEYNILKNKLSPINKEKQVNYFMNKKESREYTLEAIDDDNLESEGDEDDPIDEPADDEPADDNLSDDEPVGDLDDPKESQETKILKFKFKLASEDETLEDFLYKLRVYKVLTEFLKKEEGIKLTFTKKTILKNWLTKWIFLLAATETKSLMKEFKIRI